MCSNLLISQTMRASSVASSPNYVFCQELVEWNFGESGVIKAEHVMHKQVKERNKLYVE